MTLNRPNKRIIEYHIARLQDKNAEVRLKAISELALLPDPDSLKALQAVFENDDDPRVRKAACKCLTEHHITSLEDNSVETRLKAISELALLPDQDSLKALQAVFENDEDHQVRKAAQEAGRKVFLQLKQQDDGQADNRA